MTHGILALQLSLAQVEAWWKPLELHPVDTRHFVMSVWFYCARHVQPAGRKLRSGPVVKGDWTQLQKLHLSNVMKCGSWSPLQSHYDASGQRVELVLADLTTLAMSHIENANGSLPSPSEWNSGLRDMEHKICRIREHAGSMAGWWFGTWILWLSIYWEKYWPNWLIFFRGVETTNQYIVYIYICNNAVVAMHIPPVNPLHLRRRSRMLMKNGVSAWCWKSPRNPIVSQHIGHSTISWSQMCSLR